jgi:hypothetical protein
VAHCARPVPLACHAAPRCQNGPMKAKLVEFGHLEIEGESYRKDVVIEAGRIRKRDKAPSKALVAKWRHTPLTAAEEPAVYEEAARRGVAIEALPTAEACRLLREVARDEVYAILHVTC